MDRDLSMVTDEELLDELKSQGVTKVTRLVIKSKIDGGQIKTNKFFLIFNTPNLPQYITAGLIRIPVTPNIPNPRRCYNCQMFGHTNKMCNKKPKCPRCGEESHTEEECNNEEQCPNCLQNSRPSNHRADSKECPTWIKQKAITKIQFTENIPFKEAEKRHNVQTPTQQGSFWSLVILVIGHG